MTYSEVKKELKKEFTSFLKPLGYKSKCSNQGCTFSLSKTNKTIKFGYGIINQVDEFYTSIHGSLSIFPIQNIESEIFGIDDSTDTLLLNKAIYFNEINYRFHIKTKDDIKEWMKIIQKFYSEFAEPFFEKYKTVADIDKLLNTNPKGKVSELDNLGQHIIKGLISAKLNENPNYEELLNFYKNEVETKFKGHFMYDNCIRVITFLNDNNLAKLKAISDLTPPS